MKINSLPATALSLLFLSQLVSAEDINFDVFFGAENQCNGTATNAIRAIVGTDECSVFSYVSPGGDVKTNSEDLFNCCENFIEFVQYAGVDACQDTGGKWLYNVQSKECHSVETSNGPTWQVLKDYVRCSARYNYNGYAGSTITEEQCNDPDFIPEAGSWVIDKVGPSDGDGNAKDDGSETLATESPAQLGAAEDDITKDDSKIPESSAAASLNYMVMSAAACFIVTVAVYIL